MNPTYSLSKHAVERMRSRKISESMIFDAIKDPDHVRNESKCIRIYQKMITENGVKFLLRVFLNICKQPELVITAYKTTKLDKYGY